MRAKPRSERRRKKLSNKQQSEPIPILRSFESDGEKYVYGYTAIFDSEDSYGTAMTRDAVESSLPHLRNFPAVRFMHKIPFGQIVFDKEIENAKTFVDDHGFHVLCRIYDQCENEWKMVKSGKWGFSYGFMPDQDGGVQTRKLANGHTVPAFVKGIMYEVSVVDTPSHSDAVAYVVSRMIDGHEGRNEELEPQRKAGLIGMIECAFRGSERTQPEPRTLIQRFNENDFPKICDGKSCSVEYQRHCEANRPENYGKSCIYRTPTNEEIKRPEPQQRIAKSTLPELLDRLETVEKEVYKRENSAKSVHVIPNRPSFCKPKNPDGSEE